MNLDEAKALLESQGFEVRKRQKITYDASFLGTTLIRMDADSSASQKPVEDKFEQLRTDALAARNEMIATLDPSASSHSDNYSEKSVQQLKDIAKANFDSYCDRLEGYC